MRNLRWIGVLMLLLATVAVAAETEIPAETSSAQPVAVVVDNARQTLPPVLEGSDVRHTFTIRNTGDAPLEIEKVKTG